jgi:hypothetical protein
MGVRRSEIGDGGSEIASNVVVLGWVPFSSATVLSRNLYAEKLTVMFSEEVFVGEMNIT